MQEICNSAALPLDTNPLVRKIKCEELPALRAKPVRAGMAVRDDMDDEYGVKARNTPPMGAVGPPGEHAANAGAGGTTGAAAGGFWLAAVAGAPHPLLEPCTETGFINSQPSMAEFMTALPQLGAELSPQHTPPGYAPDLPSPGGTLNVPEYPWMKEKKTTRKSSQQVARDSTRPTTKLQHGVDVPFRFVSGSNCRMNNYSGNCAFQRQQQMAIQPLCSGSRSQGFFNEHQITLKYIELWAAAGVGGRAARGTAADIRRRSQPRRRGRVTERNTRHAL